jgi:transposase
MSWKETCLMNERVRFIGELLAEQRDMSELCMLYGVSRKTGYKWLVRYEAAGASGLEDRSHAPLHQPLTLVCWSV